MSKTALKYIQDTIPEFFAEILNMEIALGWHKGGINSLCLLKIHPPQSNLYYLSHQDLNPSSLKQDEQSNNGPMTTNWVSGIMISSNIGNFGDNGFIFLFISLTASLENLSHNYWRKTLRSGK